MGHLIALFAVFSRLLRPSNGVHTSPFGYLRELRAELRATLRARRVSRSAEEVPTSTETTPGKSTARESTSVIPAPRKPADDLPRTAMSAAVPVVNPENIPEPAALVRGHYREHERRQAQRRADRERLALAVLCDIARTTRTDTVSGVA